MSKHKLKIRFCYFNCIDYNGTNFSCVKLSVSVSLKTEIYRRGLSVIADGKNWRAQID